MEKSTNKLEKRNKIIYWIFTIWMCFGMSSAGIMQLLQIKEEIALVTHLGYPTYFLYILGTSKLLGVVAVLIPGFLVLKEWAYAGFVFTMLGALISHIFLNDAIGEVFPPIFLLVLTGISYYFRPASRRIKQSK